MQEPPKSRREEVVETIHGVRVEDPYRWLEDGSASEVKAWVEAQQAHARRFLDALPELPRIERRLLEAMDCGALGVQVPRGPYRFFTRREAGMNQASLYVVDAGAVRLLVDPAPLSSDAATALDWWYPSRDGAFVCYGVSEGGDEESTLRILETASGRPLPDRIPRCRLSSVTFEAGNAAVLYTREPEPGSVPPGEEMYHRHVWRHVLGTDPSEDAELFGQGREKTDFPALLSASADGGWTAVTVAQGWSRTAAFLRRDGGEFEPFFEGVEAIVHPWFAGDRLLAVTNFEAPNYRLVEIDPERPEPGSWLTLVAESEHVLLAAAATAGHLLVHHLVGACSRISIHGPDGLLQRELEIPPLSTVTGIGAQTASDTAYLTVEGFTSPAQSLEVDPASGAARVVARLSPPAGFDPDAFPTRQVAYRSKDGTEVTMFLVGRVEGPGPTVLTGYGGFNISRTPVWSPTVVPFWEAGGLLAIPNLRGGGEYGETWHRAGMLESKQNVFDDFAAAAEALIAWGHCSPAQLGITGGSNGGLLVGAAMTQHPELYRAVVCRVPLLDMVRYERFKIAQLWAAEYGSAADPEGFSWLWGYSPYHHVSEGVRYPDTLLTTGEEDSRVDPMHARKLAARLQHDSPQTLALLRVEPRAGHGQGKPVAKLVPEEADVWAFLLDRLALVVNNATIT